MLLADFDGVKDFASPLAVAVAAALIVASFLSVVKVWPVIRDLGRFVLPHFIPPAPGEHDVTLPARVQRVEEGAVKVAEDLAGHVVEEIEIRKADIADRKERQVELDGRLQAGDERMASIEGKLDDTLDRLKAGNPEWKP